MNAVPDETEIAAAAAHLQQIKDDAARAERARLEPVLAAFAAASTQFAARLERLETDAKPQVLELAKAIAAEVTRRELDGGHYNLPAIVNECFAIARGVDKGAVVYLNEHDYETAITGGELRPFEKEGVTIKADAALTRGSCRVETPYGDVLRDTAAALADVLAAVDGRR